MSITAKQIEEELSWVRVWFEGADTPQQFLVRTEEVRTLFDALYRLHVEPGVNPHSGGGTAPMIRFEARKIWAGAYWWSDPDLGGLERTDGRAPAMVAQAMGKETFLYQRATPL